MKSIQFILALILTGSTMLTQAQHQQDTIPTSKGDLIITFLGHGTLYFTFNDKVIYIDPVNQYADFTSLPKADMIFITHQHGDHLQPETIDLLRKENTQVILTKKCAEVYHGESKIVKNFDSLDPDGIPVQVVPAYNLVHERSPGQPFHPKGEGNGYVFTFGDKRVYVAGDTENIPEMKDIKDVDIAFLPMNLPYTMSPEMVVKAVKMLKPKILYPYHYGNTDVNELLKLMKNEDYCEVRVRAMK